jgi:hypothetical protein
MVPGPPGPPTPCAPAGSGRPYPGRRFEPAGRNALDHRRPPAAQALPARPPHGVRQARDRLVPHGAARAAGRSALAAMTPRSRAQWLLALATTLLATGAAFGIWRLLRRPTSVIVETADPAAAAETTWNGQEAYVVDPVAGHRCRRASTWRHPMVAIDGSDVQDVVKRRCAHGFLRADELPATLDRPTVLVLGDSHVDGVVSTAENATSLLEAASRDGKTPYYCLNAAAGYYSLWQHVLRARDLLPRWRPRVVVIVVFLGNDFVELDDPGMPHLDGALVEQPARERTTPETTSAREREMAIVAPYQAAFFQGLNQAMLLHREPGRLEMWMRKAAHAVATMQQAAARHDANVLWASCLAAACCRRSTSRSPITRRA